MSTDRHLTDHDARKGSFLSNARLTDIESARLRLDQSFGFRHRLAAHPLLQMPALIALAKRLPKESVRFHAAAMDRDSVFSDASNLPKLAATLEDALSGIERSGAWVQFKHIEEDVEYRALLDRFLDETRALLGSRGDRFDQREGYLFIASPGSITPYHCDHELNFICQIRGKKEIHVWDPKDRSVLSQDQLESFHAEYSLKRIRFRDELSEKARVHALEAGDGVFMPLAAPHMVKTGSEAAVTLSIVFYTEAARREAAVHSANHLLRRLGKVPAEPGASPVVDGLKWRGFDAYARLRSVVARARSRA